MTQPNLTETVAQAIRDELELTIWQDAEADPFGEIGGIEEAATAAISAAREAIREEAIANLELCQQCGARREPKL